MPTSPTSASPATVDVAAPAATRGIAFSGSLAFGDVEIGSFADRAVTMTNAGNATLTVNDISVFPSPTAADFAVSWTGGALAAGASQTVTIRFKPTEARSYDGALKVTADLTGETSVSVISGVGVAPTHRPRTTVEAGTYRVNSEIAAGRYFARPGFMCNVKRLLGLGGAPADVIMWQFVADNVEQWVVDVAHTDNYFQTDSACGTWVKDAPIRGVEATIPAGIWLVGAQVNPGIYHSTVRSGCYWERLRGFGSHGYDDIVANFFTPTDGPQTVEIKSTDAGFLTHSDCGTWAPVNSSAVPTMTTSRTDRQSSAVIQANKEQHLARRTR